MFKIYPREDIYSLYLTPGTHDTERTLNILGGKIDKVKLAFQFIFTFPGGPAIYFGDGDGLDGSKDLTIPVFFLGIQSNGRPTFTLGFKT